MSSDVWSLQHSRHFSLGEQIGLQIEMTALVRLPGESVMAGVDEEARKMTASRETVIVRKGNGNERANGADNADVRGHPSTQPHSMKKEDGTAARRAGNPIADLLRVRTG
jgi:hypothetical protein